MQTIINSSVYEDGVRVVSQTVIFSLSDDILHLGQLHSQLGHTIRRIEELSAQEPTDAITAELARLSGERSRLEGEVSAQQEHVDGYKAQ